MSVNHYEGDAEHRCAAGADTAPLLGEAYAALESAADVEAPAPAAVVAIASGDALAKELLLCKAQLAALRQGLGNERVCVQGAFAAAFFATLVFNIWFWATASNQAEKNGVAIDLTAAGVFVYLGACGGQLFFWTVAVYPVLAVCMCSCADPLLDDDVQAKPGQGQRTKRAW